MRYRSRIDKMGEILDAANGGVTKTKIMYHTFLSYNQSKEYLAVLTENNLLNYDAYTQTFKTTEKGLRFLDTFNQIGDVLKASPPPQQTWIERRCKKKYTTEEDYTRCIIKTVE
jgi:predicted transcriptional regulator